MKTIPILLAATTGVVLGQGSLSPPGGPAPTMKSLQELWDKLVQLEVECQSLQNALLNQGQQITSLQQTTQQAKDSADMAAGAAAAAQAGVAGQQQKLDSIHQDVIDGKNIGLGSAATLAGIETKLEKQKKDLADILSGVQQGSAMTGAALQKQGATLSWLLSTVDSTCNVGEYVSLDFGPDGLPAICYSDISNGTLKFAAFDGTAWQISTIDGGVSAAGASLEFGPGGNPAVSYVFEPVRDFFEVRYASFDGSAWQIATADAALIHGLFTSLAFNSSGQPAISYTGGSPARLKYASFDGTAWQPVTVDGTATAGEITSLAFSPAGLPGISYHDLANGDLRYTGFNGSAWQSVAVHTAGNVGITNSLAFTPTGSPAIAYEDFTNGNLKYAVQGPSGWKIVTAHETGVPQSVSTGSLAFSPIGQPAICYYRSDEDSLGFAVYDGTVWQISVVDNAVDAGVFCSLGFKPDGQPAIGYYDATNGDLKYAVRTFFSTP